MSATYRHLCGLWLDDVDLFGACQADLDAMGLKRFEYWSGPVSGHRGRTQFSVKLPRDCGRAVNVLKVFRFAAVHRLRPGHVDLPHMTALAAKLAVGLGLPVLSPTGGEERAVLCGVFDRPADLTGWLAYADWLDEHTGKVPCPACVGSGNYTRVRIGAADYRCRPCGGTAEVADSRAARASLIRDWAALKPAVKTRYGVPCPAAEDYRLAPPLAHLTLDGGWSWARPLDFAADPVSPEEATRVTPEPA